MKKTAFVFTLLVPLFLASFTTGLPELPIGASLPKAGVALKDISGKWTTLKEATRKNGLLVMFSCNTCPYVLTNKERTKAICRYAQKASIGVVLLNSNEGGRDKDDSFESMKKYAKKEGYQWTYVVDKNSEIADAFGANRTPECFLFNRDEKLIYHGAIDDNPQNAEAVSRHHLREAINEMLTEKEVRVQTSRSLGCAIKRKK